MKTKLLFLTAALLGAAAVVWMASGFIGANPLALLVTAVIGFVYALGLMELVQFRHATATLARALGAVSDHADFSLSAWLNTLHPSLQNTAAQRVEGDRVGFPAPLFAPYLAGLLVMLGLLGTFIGMVDTLQGAVSALQGSTELEAIRNGLAAPIEGLGLAFGTSVAGVAASAMLGLNATLSRRERILVTRELDRLIGGPLRHYSLHYNRQQTYQAMQEQARALPEVAHRLNTMAGELERMGGDLGQQLTANQQQFHQATERQYQQLASAVDRSLRDSLSASGRLAGESIAPIVAEAMQHLSTSASDTHQRILASADAAQQQRAASDADWLQEQGKQMQSLTAALHEDLSEVTSALREELGSLREEESRRDADVTRRLAEIQTSSAEKLENISAAAANSLSQIQTATAGQLAALHASTGETMNTLQRQTKDRLDSLQATTSGGLAQLHADAASSLEGLNRSIQDGIANLQRSASEHLGQLETTAAAQLATLGQALQQPMNELIATASETPRAAAEVIGKLREEMSNNARRDNQLLEERQGIMQDLTRLADALQQSTSQQRTAIEHLVAESSASLQGVSKQFGDQLAAEAGRLSEISANAASSAADIASLGESFSLAVQLFSDSNAQLVENLCRIEEAMEKSSERSDEQMSYYVAQAREIIDQSMLSQREIIEELRRLGQTGDLFAEEASG